MNRLTKTTFSAMLIAVLLGITLTGCKDNKTSSQAEGTTSAPEGTTTQTETSSIVNDSSTNEAKVLKPPSGELEADREVLLAKEFFRSIQEEDWDATRACLLDYSADLEVDVKFLIEGTEYADLIGSTEPYYIKRQSLTKDGDTQIFELIGVCNSNEYPITIKQVEGIYGVVLTTLDKEISPYDVVETVSREYLEAIQREDWEKVKECLHSEDTAEGIKAMLEDCYADLRGSEGELVYSDIFSANNSDEYKAYFYLELGDTVEDSLYDVTVVIEEDGDYYIKAPSGVDTTLGEAQPVEGSVEE